MDTVESLLAQLVAIPSVNPMGRALSGPDYLEGRLTDFLETYVRRLRVDYRRDEVAPGRANLVAVYAPPGARRTLLWDAHQDTVPVDGMTVPPFEPRIAGGRLYGRGSCDVKGSLAAMLTAFARLVASRPPGSAAVVLACTVDEEFTHLGSSRLAAERPAADLGIVAEPTGLDLVTRHKGAVRWKLRTRGVACHSSAPHLGRNAIYRMAHVVTALAEYADRLAAAEPDPVLGPPSLSVGRIEGGQSVNVVPDGCTIEIDRRVLPGEDPAACPADVLAFLSERLGGLDDIEALPPWVNMPALLPRVPEAWREAIAGAVRSVTGREPAQVGVPYGTDAGPLSQAGLPCLVFGPGDIAQAHTRDEWIDLDQLRAAVEIYFEMARAMGRVQDEWRDG